MSKALLLSGGIDSTAVAAWLHPKIAAVVDYGQVSAEGEIRSARAVANALGISIQVIKADCSSIGCGLLTGHELSPISPTPEWWPFRNQLLITLVGAWAVQRGIEELLVGPVKGDDRHADGTRKFYDSINALLSNQEGGLKVSVPAIEMTSVELIKISGVSADILGWTHSCHQSEWACGACPGCIKHLQVLKELGTNAY